MNSLNEFGDFLEKVFRQFKDELYKNAPFDRTYKGRITDKVEGKYHKYKVSINGKTHTVSSSIDCIIGDYVWVCAPCGNEQQMFIRCKTK